MTLLIENLLGVGMKYMEMNYPQSNHRSPSTTLTNTKRMAAQAIQALEVDQKSPIPYRSPLGTRPNKMGMWLTIHERQRLN